MATSAIKVNPLLMFDGQAEAAMTFYASVIPDSAILSIRRYGSGDDGVEGSVERASFSLAGSRYIFIDSPVKHPFSFTPSISLFVTCATTSEVDRVFTALAAGGSVMMPLGEYPFSRRFGWTSDKFGVSWQVSVS